MHPYLLYNGHIVKATEPCLSPLDRGFLLGDGLFETLRSYNGRIPFLDLHLQRLRQGLLLLGFPNKGIDFDNIGKMARQLLIKNDTEDAYIRLTITRKGYSNSALLPKWGAGEVNWVLITRPLPPALEQDRKKGIRAIICCVRKNNFSPTARIKSINYLDMIIAKREAFLEGAKEAILLDERGFLAEAATSNLFWVQGGVLYTPSLDMPILPGITRAKILKIAKQLGIPYKEGHYSPKMLIESKEAFITNSICEAIPLISIGNQNISDGRPGDITIKLQGRYRGIVYKNISYT